MQFPLTRLEVWNVLASPWAEYLHCLCSQGRQWNALMVNTQSRPEDQVVRHTDMCRYIWIYVNIVSSWKIKLWPVLKPDWILMFHTNFSKVVTIRKLWKLMCISDKLLQGCNSKEILQKKSRIRETLNLSTNADSSTNNEKKNKKKIRRKKEKNMGRSK